jgi:prepilin peptidase CpaA
MTPQWPEASALAAVAVGIVATVCDIRTRRIPNSLTFGAAAVAFSFFSATGGVTAFTVSLAGWGIGLALFLPFFLLGGMGAGDVKLLAAVGAWLGPRQVIWSGLYGALAGGVLAVVLALGSGYLRDALRNLWNLLGFWRAAGLQPHPELTLARAKGPRLAYALPITIGMVAALWLR